MTSTKHTWATACPETDAPPRDMVASEQERAVGERIPVIHPLGALAISVKNNTRKAVGLLIVLGIVSLLLLRNQGDKTIPDRGVNAPGLPGKALALPSEQREVSPAPTKADQLEAKFKTLLDQPDTFERGQALRAILRIWGQFDFLGAVAAIEAEISLDILNRIHLVDFALEGWATVDPESAWKWGIESLQALPPRNTVFGETMWGFGHERMGVVFSILMDRGDFELVSSLIAASPTGTVNLYVKPLVSAWSTKDNGTRVLAWIDHLPQRSAERLNGLLGAAMAFSSNSLADLHNLIVAHPDKTEIRMIGMGVIESFAKAGSDAEALFLVEGVARDNASGSFDSIIAAYFRRQEFELGMAKNLDREIQLLRNLQSPSTSTTILALYARRTTLSAPDAAIAAVSRVLPAEQQLGSLTQIVDTLAKSDPANALRVIDRNQTLAPSTKDELKGVVSRLQ